MHHSTTFVLLCIPVHFADSTRCQYAKKIPLALSCFSPAFPEVTWIHCREVFMLLFVNNAVHNLMWSITYTLNVVTLTKTGVCKLKLLVTVLTYLLLNSLSLGIMQGIFKHFSKFPSIQTYMYDHWLPLCKRHQSATQQKKSPLWFLCQPQKHTVTPFILKNWHFTSRTRN